MDAQFYGHADPVLAHKQEMVMNYLKNQHWEANNGLMPLMEDTKFPMTPFRPDERAERYELPQYMPPYDITPLPQTPPHSMTLSPLKAHSGAHVDYRTMAAYNGDAMDGYSHRSSHSASPVTPAMSQMAASYQTAAGAPAALNQHMCGVPPPDSMLYGYGHARTHAPAHAHVQAHAHAHAHGPYADAHAHGLYASELARGRYVGAPAHDLYEMRASATGSPPPPCDAWNGVHQHFPYYDMRGTPASQQMDPILQHAMRQAMEQASMVGSQPSRKPPIAALDAVTVAAVVAAPSYFGTPLRSGLPHGFEKPRARDKMERQRVAAPKAAAAKLGFDLAKCGYSDLGQLLEDTKECEGEEDTNYSERFEQLRREEQVRSKEKERFEADYYSSAAVQQPAVDLKALFGDDDDDDIELLAAFMPLPCERPKSGVDKVAIGVAEKSFENEVLAENTKVATRATASASKTLHPNVQSLEQGSAHDDDYYYDKEEAPLRGFEDNEANKENRGVKIKKFGHAIKIDCVKIATLKEPANDDLGTPTMHFDYDSRWEIQAQIKSPEATATSVRLVPEPLVFKSPLVARKRRSDDVRQEHNDECGEVPLPTRSSRREPCYDWYMFGVCLKGGSCANSHFTHCSDFGKRISAFKNKPCVDEGIGHECKHGSKCGFAHMGDAIRRPMPVEYVDKQYFTLLLRDEAVLKYPFGIYV